MCALHEDRASAVGSTHLVDALSREFNVPLDMVQSLYREEFERLKSKARIHQFVSALAARSTREVLRARTFNRRCDRD
jgi:Protein of unknown function (DUF3562)